MKSQRKDQFERTIALLSLIFSIIALYFAWQANQIAQKQSLEEVEVLDVIYESNGINSNNSTGCSYRVILSNKGGAPTSLINFNTIIHFKDHSLKIKGRGDPFIRDFRYFFPEDVADRSEIPITYNNDIGLFDQFYSFADPDNHLLVLPFILEGGITKSIVYQVTLYFDTMRINEISHMPIGNYPWDWDKNLEIINKDFSPVDVSIELFLASDRVIETPKKPCTYIKEENSLKVTK